MLIVDPADDLSPPTGSQRSHRDAVNAARAA